MWFFRAEALQSVLMISSPSDVYHRFKDHGPKSRLNLDQWTYQAADNVLKKWQRKYTDYIYNHVNNSGQDDRRLHPLAGTSVNDMLAEFSRFNPTVILVGYVLMVSRLYKPLGTTVNFFRSYTPQRRCAVALSVACDQALDWLLLVV